MTIEENESENRSDKVAIQYNHITVLLMYYIIRYGSCQDSPRPPLKLGMALHLGLCTLLLAGDIAESPQLSPGQGQHLT